jgi:hypothetical protein
MLVQDLNQPGNKAYLLVGPDDGQPLSLDDSGLVSTAFHHGHLSMFIVEGNQTNNNFLGNTFNVTVGGNAVIDHESPFMDQRVFPLTVNLDDGAVQGVIDIASPIVPIDSPRFASSNGTRTRMIAVGLTSPDSTESSTNFQAGTNSTVGARNIVDIEKFNGSRILLISDSSPFSTLYNNNATGLQMLNINETRFADRLADWTTNYDSNTTIILDNYHYETAPVQVNNGVSLNLPIGRLFAGALAIVLSTVDTSYNGFLADSRPFIIGLALFTTWSLYGGLVRKYATEKRGKDDLPIPIVEKTIVAESEQRLAFLNTLRDQAFYRSGLQQLHAVLDGLVMREFGMPIGKVSNEQLAARLGPELGLQTSKLFNKLIKITRHATGETRFLFPPVLNWKRTTSSITWQTEQFLNQLGITMIGGDAKKKDIDYKTRRL